jgi:hypothetical protein
MEDELNPWIYSDRRQWVADEESEDGGRFRPVAWKEIALEQEETIRRLRGFQKIISDLDRNENGRHEGDSDVGDRTGVSQGNPRLWSDRVIGFDMSGRPYVMPDREHRHDPDAWLKK